MKKMIREMMLRKLEGETEEQKEVEEVVEEAKKEIGEGELMEMIMDEINSKTLNIIGTFDEKQVAYVREFANHLWYYEADEKRPLYINISSHGGFCSSLLAILDILEEVKEEWGCTIITKCNGYAESCGFILWCTGDERYMGKYGELMVHSIAYSYNSNLLEHEKELKRTKKMQEKIDKVIMEKTGIKKQQLNKWYKNGDTFLDYEDCLKLGLLTLEEDEE